ncbi:hypothetical protein LQZ44_15460 [Alcaligenes nematophilus]|uniref:hypothetical protein n=1 Tax=Alcaligenes nematophilus TaxID=2994643 RepID=UPI0035B507EA
MRRSLQLLSEYKCALGNEIAIDERFAHIFHVNLRKTGYLPRLPAWVAYMRLPSWLIKLGYLLILASWALGGFALFALYKSARAWARCAVHSSLELRGAPLALLFSSRAEHCIDQAGQSPHIQAWILLNGVAAAGRSERRYVHIAQLYGLRQVAHALWLALLACVALLLDRRYARWSLQSYTAYDWFLYRISLQTLEATHLVMAEHYDRWATLADLLANNASNSCTLVLVQHGTLKGLNNAQPEPLALPYKLSAVSRLYCYNQPDCDFFLQAVLEPAGCMRCQISFYTPTIRLVPHPRSTAHTTLVLIVGHPTCEALHTALFERLSTEQVDVIYKVHPRSPASPQVAKIGWFIWEDKNEFPQVDLVVSYPSTLVDEYRAMNTHVITHPMRSGVKEVNEIVELILKKACRKPL